jgi:hypothetical protein
MKRDETDEDLGRISLFMHPDMLRCQTLSSMWTLGEDQPVIPRVTFIRWALRLPLERIGSLTSTFVPARVATLAVKQAYACTTGAISIRA